MCANKIKQQPKPKRCKSSPGRVYQLSKLSKKTCVNWLSGVLRLFFWPLTLDFFALGSLGTWTFSAVTIVSWVIGAPSHPSSGRSAQDFKKNCCMQFWIVDKPPLTKGGGANKHCHKESSPIQSTGLTLELFSAGDPHGRNMPGNAGHTSFLGLPLLPAER